MGHVVPDPATQNRCSIALAILRERQRSPAIRRDTRNYGKNHPRFRQKFAAGGAVDDPDDAAVDKEVDKAMDKAAAGADVRMNGAGRARRSTTTASFESLCTSGASKRRQIRNIAVIIKTGFGDLPVRISAVLSLIPLNQAPAFKRVQSPREISLRQLLAAAPPAHVFHRP